MSDELPCQCDYCMLSREAADLRAKLSEATAARDHAMATLEMVRAFVDAALVARTGSAANPGA